MNRKTGMSLRLVSVAMLVMLCATAGVASAAAADAAKLFLLTQSKGFDHPVVQPGKDGSPSLVEKTFRELAEKTKLFEVEATRDGAQLTPEKLKSTNIVVFYTTLDVLTDDQLKAFDEWIKNGGLFLGIHSATIRCTASPHT